MSDSEDDFASADEGDVDKPAGEAKRNKSQEDAKAQSHQDEKKPAESQQVKDVKPKQVAGKAKGQKQKSESKKEESRKETAKPQTQQERPQSGGKGKKGKQKGGKGKGGGGATTQKEEDQKNKASTDDSQNVSPKGATAFEDKSEDKELTEKKPVTKEIADAPAPEKDGNNVEPVKDVIVKQSDKDTSSVVTPQKSQAQDLTEEANAEALSGSENKQQSDPGLIKSPSSQSISRPPPDHTDQQENVLDKLSGAAKEKKSGWGWGWGSSLLEVASTSVNTFTKEVGEGFHTMIETVESTLNVPNPEDLAECNKKESQEKEDENSDDNAETQGSQKDQPQTSQSSEQTDQSGSKPKVPGAEADKPESGGAEEQASGDSWFSSWGVTNIAKKIESTSKTLVTSGLDVLETVGKKTFDAINEHDPGFKKTRNFLKDRGDKPNLSAILRDAKEQEELRAQQEKESEEARKAHFGSLFDDYQGLAHLEALEMLSNQCEKRVNSLLSALPPDSMATIKPTLLQVKQQFEMGEEEEEEEIEDQEFVILITDLLKQLNVGTTPAKLIKAHEGIETSFKENSVTEEHKPDPKDIHRVAISGLAEFTSMSIEQFHKAGELILAQMAKLSDFTATSETLLKLTRVLSAEVNILSKKFTDELNKLESGDEIKVNHLVTNVYLEASNSSSYIQDGFQLLLPVMQQAVIEKSQEPAT